MCRGGGTGRRAGLKILFSQESVGSIPTPGTIIGVWRSWLARHVWDVEAAGSSPATPTSLE